MATATTTHSGGKDGDHEEKDDTTLTIHMTVRMKVSITRTNGQLEQINC